MFLSGEPHAPPVAAPCQQAYLVGSLHAALAVLIALGDGAAAAEASTSTSRCRPA